MNVQPRALQEDPVPAKWKTRWYRTRERFLRFLSRFLRMPAPLEVNQALKNQRWQGVQIGEEKYLGHCPRHPDELLLDVGRGFFRCIVCHAGTYLGFPDYERHTDPHQYLQITIPTQRPNQVYLQAVKGGAGAHTAALEAIPRWLVKLRQEPKKE